MHPIRRVLPVVALTAAALALSGCGGTTSSGSGTAGSTTIAPYMPFAMCASTGFVPQWYM
jgi:hypothetical protein